MHKTNRIIKLSMVLLSSIILTGCVEETVYYTDYYDDGSGYTSSYQTGYHSSYSTDIRKNKHHHNKHVPKNNGYESSGQVQSSTRDYTRSGSNQANNGYSSSMSTQTNHAYSSSNSTQSNNGYSSSGTTQSNAYVSTAESKPSSDYRSNNSDYHDNMLSGYNLAYNKPQKKQTQPTQAEPVDQNNQAQQLAADGFTSSNG